MDKVKVILGLEKKSVCCDCCWQQNLFSCFHGRIQWTEELLKVVSCKLRLDNNGLYVLLLLFLLFTAWLLIVYEQYKINRNIVMQRVNGIATLG